MSSVFPAFPPSPPILSDDASYRPAPRRTYGRPRPTSPPPDEDPLPSLFQPTTELHISPAKGLLDRWAVASSSWRESLAVLDATGSFEDGVESAKQEMEPMRMNVRTDLLARPQEPVREAWDQDVGLEEAKSEMERMRRAAREENAPTHTESRLEVPKPNLGVSFSSSSLTALSTSPPPSSPLGVHNFLRPAEAMEEEAMPIRKKASGRVKRVIASPDEKASDDVCTRKPISPVPYQASPPVHDPERTPRNSTSSGPHRTKAAIPVRPPTPDSDDEVAPIVDVQKFLSILAEDDKQSDKERERSTESINDPAGLFDDDEVGKGTKSKTSKVSKAVKSLNQKELADMRKDIARAQRERPLTIPKPELQRLPITSWLAKAVQAITTVANSRNNVPVLTIGHGSSPTTPLHTNLPDEIVAFTPSSVDRNPTRTEQSERTSAALMKARSSSPTVRRRKRHNLIHAALEDQDEERLETIDELLEQENKRRQQLEATKRLSAAKAAVLRASVKPAGDAESDDDIDIYYEAPRAATFVPHLGKDAGRRVMPDAKAILNKTSATPAVTKQRQAMLRRAGKNARPKDEVTETFVHFAGKTYKHAELRKANAGAVPAGQKKGRDQNISQTQVNEMTKAKHQRQIAAIQRQKEEEWGRVRALPKKEQQDVKTVLEMTAKAAEEREEDSDEEDGEDGEFVPEGSEGEEELEEGVRTNYSGEETEVVAGSEEEDGAGSERADTDKENQPTEAAGSDEDELAPIIRRKPWASTRNALNSDDEGDTSPGMASARPPLAEITIPQQLLMGGDLDLEGFGSEEGGFSQLFEATQPVDQPTFVDGFAHMRDPPLALLPAHALLPQVDISETQAGRDNALIAGEIEAAIEGSIPTHRKPRSQYLNDQGFFTQTRPQGPSGSQLYDDEASSSKGRSTLAGRSELSLIDFGFGDTPPRRPIPSSTEKGSESRPSFSPTRGTPTLSRLKRRASPDLQDEDAPSSSFRMVEDEEVPKNAFARLMNDAKRPRGKVAVQTNLVDEQAEESDEDNGWAPVSDAEVEEDNDDDDGYVPDLVDDAHIDEEEKKRQDDLAREKAREVAQADDACREAEARKITEGQHRTKRRGVDFLSDGESDEGKPHRMSKKQRRKRKLDKEDGLDKLEGEANVFKQAYENDLENDVDSIDGDPESERQGLLSPVKANQSARETWELLKQRGRMNRQKDQVAENEDLDREMGLDGAGIGRRSQEENDFELVDTEEIQFSISRSIRATAASGTVGTDQTALWKATVTRNVESYVQYVRDESQTIRRMGGAAGVSVIVNSSRGGLAYRSAPLKQSASSFGGSAPSRQGSGSAILPKTNKFI